uniref:Uncharacterized protein n=1 Tax=viral metagenome TaxID=1070528 RepID=A0A6C0L1B3_9ZZZZ|tara:strand:- start:36626 stop:36838 length:213 start_codon:yes stop_codon:yes gene_type:complete
MNIVFRYFNQKYISNIFKRLFHHEKIPNGRWNLEDKYIGSMSNTAIKNNEFNNHDHCGGELCKYPPKIKK